MFSRILRPDATWLKFAKKSGHWFWVDLLFAQDSIISKIGLKASFIFLHETLQQFCSSPIQAETEVEVDWARARRPGPNSKARRNKALGRQARLA